MLNEPKHSDRMTKQIWFFFFQNSKHSLLFMMNVHGKKVLSQKNKVFKMIFKAGTFLAFSIIYLNLFLDFLLMVSLYSLFKHCNGKHNIIKDGKNNILTWNSNILNLSLFSSVLVRHIVDDKNMCIFKCNLFSCFICQ